MESQWKQQVTFTFFITRCETGNVSNGGIDPRGFSDTLNSDSVQQMITKYLQEVCKNFFPFCKYTSMRGWFSRKICMWMCPPDYEILTLAVPICPNLPPVSIPISYKKHLILLKLGAYYHNLLKVHPVYVNRAPSSVMKTPRLKNSWNSIPKGRHV